MGFARRTAAAPGAWGRPADPPGFKPEGVEQVPAGADGLDQPPGDRPGRDPRVKAPVSVPAVLAMMIEKPDWARKPGDAFLAQEKNSGTPLDDRAGKRSVPSLSGRPPSSRRWADEETILIPPPIPRGSMCRPTTRASSTAAWPIPPPLPPPIAHDGRVFEKDLGPGTAKAAPAVRAFDPKRSRKRVD